MDKIILITGGTGLLGSALIRNYPNKYDVIATTSDTPHSANNKIIKMDITKLIEVKQVFDKYNPDIVIHTASIGNVDYCEKNQDQAYQVNVIGTRNIISNCKKHGSKLLFMSSNAVFDGRNPPYNEKDKPNPLNYYGKTKLMSEIDVQESGIEYAIIRLILMYGWNNPQERKNPVTWLIDLLRMNKKVKLVNDTYANPLLNIQAVRAIWNVIQLNEKGIFHVAGKERVNRYEFGLHVADAFGLNKNLIDQVDSDYFRGLAPRMPDTTYDTTKMVKKLRVKPLSVKNGLRWMRENNRE